MQLQIIRVKAMNKQIFITLAQLKNGHSGQILVISGGWGLQRRLNQIGIHIGDHFRVTRNAALGGPVMIMVHQAEIALGRGLAEHIVVELDQE